MATVVMTPRTDSRRQSSKDSSSFELTKSPGEATASPRRGLPPRVVRQFSPQRALKLRGFRQRPPSPRPPQPKPSLVNTSAKSNLQAVLARADPRAALIQSQQMKQKSEHIGHVLKALFGGTEEPEPEPEAERRCGRCPVIFPWSYGLLLWDFACAFLLVVWIAGVLPMCVAFADEFNTAFRTCDTVVDVFFIADLVKNFFVAYNDGYGHTVTDHRAIARSYLRGWFAIDLVACFPLGWFSSFIWGAGGERQSASLLMLRLCKMGKLVRLVRIKRAFRDLSALQERGYLDSNLSTERGLLIIAQLFLFVHIMGCVQFFVARLVDFEEDTWVARVRLSPTRPLLDESWPTQYVVTLYHAALQLGMGPGASDHPQRSEEYALHVISFLLGAAVTAHLFATLAATLAERDPAELEFQQNISTLKQYMRHSRMPRGLRANLLFYFETRFPGQRAFDEQRILNQLTRPLLEEVCLHRSEAALKDTFLMAAAVGTEPLADEVRRELACVLVRRVFVRGDCVIRAGVFSDAMFFIAAGSVDIIGSQGDLIRTLHQGTYFGEMALMTTGNKASATVRVSEQPGYMEGYMLLRHDFETLVERHPEFKQFLQSIVEYRQRERQVQDASRAADPSSSDAAGCETSLREATQAEVRRDVSLRSLKAARAGRRPSCDGNGRRPSCGDNNGRRSSCDAGSMTRGRRASRDGGTPSPSKLRGSAADRLTRSAPPSSPPSTEENSARPSNNSSPQSSPPLWDSGGTSVRFSSSVRFSGAEAAPVGSEHSLSSTRKRSFSAPHMMSSKDSKVGSTVEDRLTLRSRRPSAPATPKRPVLYLDPEPQPQPEPGPAAASRQGSSADDMRI